MSYMYKTDFNSAMIIFCQSLSHTLNASIKNVEATYYNTLNTQNVNQIKYLFITYLRFYKLLTSYKKVG